MSIPKEVSLFIDAKILQRKLEILIVCAGSAKFQFRFGKIEELVETEKHKNYKALTIGRE